MRVAFLAASLILVAALAGCAGKDKDTDFHVTCADGTELHSEDFSNVTTNADLLKKCPGATVTRTTTTSTPSAPNVLPVPALEVSDNGTVTRVTLIGGNLTFDASNSTDADGNITGVAVSVTDSNQTRTASLYDPVKKQFKTATFKFDRPGAVTVTLAVVDDRAGFATNVSKVYVNEQIAKGGASITLPEAALAEEGSPLHDVCLGASASPLGTSGPVVDSQYFARESIPLQANATFIEVVSEEDVVMTICNPEGTPVSDELVEGTVVSNQPIPLPASGTDNYEVAFYATAPGATTAVTITVHYEPAAAQPAAA